MRLFCFISNHTYSLIPKSRTQKGRTHLWAYGLYDVIVYLRSAWNESKQSSQRNSQPPSRNDGGTCKDWYICVNTQIDSIYVCK
jgi:hypothetical protein